MSMLGKVPGMVRWAMAAAGAMVVATVVSNAANYAYSLVMSRMLGPERFGEFTALLGVLMILSIATQLVQTVVARYVTELRSGRDPGSVPAFVNRLARVMAVVGLAAFVVSVPLAWPVAAALQIDHIAPVVATMSALVLGFVVPVAWGRFQGEQAFWRLGTSMVVLNLARVAVGVALVAVGFGVSGAIAATTIATVFVAAMVLPALRAPSSPSAGAGPELATLARFALPTLGALVAWAMLTNFDVVIVKAMAVPADAGYYGAAATVGKIALFLPTALGLVILPKGAARHHAGVDSRGILRRTGQALVVVSGALTAICALWGDRVVHLMFTSEYAPAADLLVPIVVAMSCFALANVMLFYYLGVGRTTFSVVLIVAMVFQIALLLLVASSPKEAALVQMAVGIGIVAANEALYVPLLRPLPKARRAGGSGDPPPA
ncbi:MAG: oligosaccharide flippase family protein [Thermoleophilia bacterium]|nr:oligosaccharide flippase family protein [Thermoleophilia bacterium]